MRLLPTRRYRALYLPLPAFMPSCLTWYEVRQILVPAFAAASIPVHRSCSFLPFNTYLGQLTVRGLQFFRGSLLLAWATAIFSGNIP